ncbi:cell division inhibitor [Flavipsychrobacter stenotrophus]|uniref:Cell division inhibitor n=1 Tax=Flavipsychrobacter stenotrophus TaxID=2077091 RepID=A0A2S7T0X1_9BACT|nr:SRPBCC family protein [Flavipsychrobacter stenotrophus]PQJ12507.1 cell division inhibitor [Flavipsychrobacter stenotrophus]
MKIYTLHREQVLPISLKEAWDFFSTPLNLEKITPAEMGFVVLTDVKGKSIYKGMLIEYRVSPLLGIKMKWVTEIGDVSEPYKFVDNQLKGPYALWEHTHTFKEVPGGVLMHDDVRYAIPLGILGEIAHVLVVKNKLKNIFDFRGETLKKYFKG